MGIEFLSHIAIPLIVVFVLLLFKAVNREKPIGWENCNEIAFELTVLSIGATGGIFVDPALIQRFGKNVGVYGILVVLIDLAFAGWLIYRERWRRGKDTTSSQGMLDLFIGFMCVAITTGVIYISR